MKRMIPYLKPYRLQLVLGPAAKLLEAVLELTLPVFMARMVDRGIIPGDSGYLLRTGGLMLLIACVGLASALFCQYSASVAATGFGAALRRDLFRRIQHLPAGRLDALGADTLTTRVTNDVNQMQLGLAMIIRLLIRAPFVSIGCIAAAMTVDLPLSAVMAVAVPLFALVLVPVMAVSSRLYTRVQQRLDRLSAVLRENLSGVRVVRAFGRQQGERRRVDGSVDAVRDSAVRVSRVSTLLHPLTTGIMNMAIVAILWFGGVRIQIGAMTPGQVVAFISYVTQVLTALIAVANLVVTLTRAHASLGRVDAVLDLPEEADGAVTAPVDGAPAVVFEDVCFRYASTGEEALSHLSFTLPQGQSLGVIGGTGAGKTTLVDLLQRFVRPTAGHIRLEGVDLADWAADALRARLGLVSQRVVLFRGTVADNLRWGAPDATDDDLWRAAETAQAAGFLRQMPDGLASPVGRGGKGFSGGQRQRLAIARALVRRPRVLILDDAASALDFATDARLRRALAADGGDRALIVISQRASTVRDCDRILVLADGRAVGLGTHDELMTGCEEYRAIVSSQQDV